MMTISIASGVGIGRLLLVAASGLALVACSDDPEVEPVAETTTLSVTSTTITVPQTAPPPNTASVPTTQATAPPTPASPVAPTPTLEGRRASGVNGLEGTYYADCEAARRAGAAPLHRGDPGYRPELDPDGDGTACE